MFSGRSEALIALCVENHLFVLKSLQLSFPSPPLGLEDKVFFHLPSSSWGFCRCLQYPFAAVSFPDGRDYSDIPCMAPSRCFRWLFLASSVPLPDAGFLFEMESGPSAWNPSCRYTRNSQRQSHLLCFVCCSFCGTSWHSAHSLVTTMHSPPASNYYKILFLSNHILENVILGSDLTPTCATSHLPLHEVLSAFCFPLHMSNTCFSSSPWALIFAFLSSPAHSAIRWAAPMCTHSLVKSHCPYHRFLNLPFHCWLTSCQISGALARELRLLAWGRPKVSHELGFERVGQII